MADNTPQSREEALLQNILGAHNELGIPQSRIEKIWQYALGIDGIVLDPPQSRIEVLAIQVAELVRNGGGVTPTGTITITSNDTYDVRQYANAAVGVYGTEDALVDGSMSGTYVNPRITKVHAYGFYAQDELTAVKLASVTSLGTNAFMTYYNPKLEYVELPSATSIGNYCFKGQKSLQVLNLYSLSRTTIPTLNNIGAFDNTPIADGTGYIVINDELVDTLKAATNWSTYASQIVSYSYAVEHDLIEEIEYDEPDVVYHTLEDALLTGSLNNSYENDRITILTSDGLRAAANLLSVSFPALTNIGARALYGCQYLTDVNLPKVTSLGTSSFYNCKALTNLSLPKVTSIGSTAFQGCTNLEWLSFDEITAVPTTNANAFQGCTSLAALYFPDALVDTAKAASGWSDYASIIKPLSEKPTA